MTTENGMMAPTPALSLLGSFGSTSRGRGSAHRRWLTLLLLPMLSLAPPAAAQDCDIIDWDDVGFFRRCLEERPNPADWPTIEGRTTLHRAMYSFANPTVVVLLLEAGFDPNARADNGVTPLHYGVQHRNPVVTSHLLRAGADPNAVDNGGYTPLHSAVMHADQDTRARVTTLLLDAGARVTTLLLDAGADPSALANDGWTPFHWAVWRRMSRALSVFLERGMASGLTALHQAILLGDSETAMSLLAGSDDATASDDLGWNSLHYAVSMGERQILMAILEEGGDPNARTANGWTALHLAAEPDMVEALVAAGAEINVSNDSGRTSLHEAAAWRSAAVVEALLDAGADPTLEDDDRPADQAWAVSSDSAVMRRLGDSELVAADQDQNAANQNQLDTLRIDSLMAVVADLMQSTALAVARGDEEAISEPLFELEYSVSPQILGELANGACESASAFTWVASTARELIRAIGDMRHSQGLLGVCAAENRDRYL